MCKLEPGSICIVTPNLGTLERKEEGKEKGKRKREKKKGKEKGKREREKKKAKEKGKKKTLFRCFIASLLHMRGQKPLGGDIVYVRFGTWGLRLLFLPLGANVVPCS